MQHEHNVSIAKSEHPGAPQREYWITVGQRLRGSSEPFERIKLIQSIGGKGRVLKHAADIAREYGCQYHDLTVPF